jgi:hypothetical protein
MVIGARIPECVIERHRRLFEAWTQPSQLKQWWGPESVTFRPICMPSCSSLILFSISPREIEGSGEFGHHGRAFGQTSEQRSSCSIGIAPDGFHANCFGSVSAS